MCIQEGIKNTHPLYDEQLPMLCGIVYYYLVSDTKVRHFHETTKGFANYFLEMFSEGALCLRNSLSRYSLSASISDMVRCKRLISSFCFSRSSLTERSFLLILSNVAIILPMSNRTPITKTQVKDSPNIMSFILRFAPQRYDNILNPPRILPTNLPTLLLIIPNYSHSTHSADSF